MLIALFAALVMAAPSAHAQSASSRARTDAIAIRIGISLGDVTRDDGDYFGEPVIQAARLCSRADADQILCSELVRLMVGARAASSRASSVDDRPVRYGQL